MEVLAYPPARIVATYSMKKKKGSLEGASLQNKLDTDRYNIVMKEANSLIASNPNILTTSSRSYFRMFSLCKPLFDRGMDNPGTGVRARNAAAIPIIIGSSMVRCWTWNVRSTKCAHRSTRKILNIHVSQDEPCLSTCGA